MSLNPNNGFPFFIHNIHEYKEDDDVQNRTLCIPVKTKAESSMLEVQVRVICCPNFKHFQICFRESDFERRRHQRVNVRRRHQVRRVGFTAPHQVRRVGSRHRSYWVVGGEGFVFGFCLAVRKTKAQVASHQSSMTISNLEISKFEMSYKLLS